MENSYLKKRVMNRIYIQYTKNIIVRYMEYILPGAFLASLFASVSIRNVVNNMPKDDPSHVFNFLLFAVRNTEWLVQAILGVACIWAIGVMGRFGYKNVHLVRNFNPKGWNFLRLRY